jgi:hypothetical protein
MDRNRTVAGLIAVANASTADLSALSGYNVTDESQFSLSN